VLLGAHVTFYYLLFCQQERCNYATGWMWLEYNVYWISWG
jgi:hypothetical protein